MERTYRIYSLSDRNVITGAYGREFLDDGAALDQARGLLAAHPAVEIWQTDRMVGRLERMPSDDSVEHSSLSEQLPTAAACRRSG